MIKSMTGYGKAEAILEAGKLTVEIRTLNAKNADISIKSSLLPKDKDLQMRAKIAESLQRGTIDVFITFDANAVDSAKQINMDVARSYMNQAKALANEFGSPNITFSKDSCATLLNAVLRMPDVLESKKQDIITEENWPLVEDAFDRALEAINDYRAKEGVALYNDVTSRVQNILDIYKEIEALEPERIAAVREKISKGLEELGQKVDQTRFEQEMIFYIEKLDINEEKVRLRQHCKYFKDTIDSEPYPGKKLGFIIQEMGREINTTGSKANHADVQKCVVRMKDELEKIREQSLNIL